MFRAIFQWIISHITRFFTSRAFDILSDAGLLGFALTFFLPHLQWVFNTSPIQDRTFAIGLIRMYANDIVEYSRVYIGFAVIVLIWLALKVPRWIHETKVESRTEKRDEERHQELLKAIHSITQEIRRDRDERNNPPRADNDKV